VYQKSVNGPRTHPNSVTLRGESYDANIKRLRVLHAYTRADIQSRRTAVLGAASLDFTPILRDPRALANVAQRMRSVPQRIEIRADDLEASEVDEGMVIHSKLSYRILPGGCADAGSAAQVTQAGANCIRHLSLNERVASFGRVGDPHYLADPQKRAAAVAAYQRTYSQSQAATAQHIADLRKMLANPQQSADILRQLGAPEVQRLRGLSDEQLADEIANAAVHTVEQVIFVPRQETPAQNPLIQKMHIATDDRTASAVQLAMHGGAVSPEAMKVEENEPATKFHVLPRLIVGGERQGVAKETDIDLGTYIYLTGFTLGRDYEWSWGDSVTINWCVVGCSQTYSVNLYAGLQAGVGLRFPIQTQLTYHQEIQPNQTASATLTPTFKPINGSADQFSETGLETDQLFGGQEIVAGAQADAGFNLNLPVVGNQGNSDTEGVDLTSYLPAPLTGGHFTPPAPGGPALNPTIIAQDVDLLLGLLNFGVVGAQLLPALEVTIGSDKLQFALADELSNKQTIVTSSGKAIPVAVEKSGSFDSHFKFGNPVYRLTFTETPGLSLHLFVDLDIWSDSWDFIAWIPQLSITLPPNGVEFGCHAGTTCIRDFRPVLDAAATSTNLPELAALGCTQHGTEMPCLTLAGYRRCQQVVKQGGLLGVQECTMGGMLPKSSVDADQMLLRNNQCHHNPDAGDYACPVQGGMYDLCETFLKNGTVASCIVLVPQSTEDILKRGGCSEDNAHSGQFSCPRSMMGLCGLYVNNKVILACTPNGK
jgi:hypothetical protein